MLYSDNNKEAICVDEDYNISQQQQEEEEKEEEEAVSFKKRQKELYGRYGSYACYLDNLIKERPHFRERLSNRMLECLSAIRIPDILYIYLPVSAKDEKNDEFPFPYPSYIAVCIDVLDIIPVPIRLKWSDDQTSLWYSSVIMKKVNQSSTLQTGGTTCVRFPSFGYLTTVQFEEASTIIDIFFRDFSSYRVHIPYPNHSNYSKHVIYIDLRCSQKFIQAYNEKSFTPVTELYRNNHKKKEH